MVTVFDFGSRTSASGPRLSLPESDRFDAARYYRMAAATSLMLPRSRFTANQCVPSPSRKPARSLTHRDIGIERRGTASGDDHSANAGSPAVTALAPPDPSTTALCAAWIAPSHGRTTAIVCLSMRPNSSGDPTFEEASCVRTSVQEQTAASTSRVGCLAISVKHCCTRCAAGLQALASEARRAPCGAGWSCSHAFR